MPSLSSKLLPSASSPSLSSYSSPGIASTPLQLVNIVEEDIAMRAGSEPVLKKRRGNPPSSGFELEE